MDKFKSGNKRSIRGFSYELKDFKSENCGFGKNLAKKWRASRTCLKIVDFESI